MRIHTTSATHQVLLGIRPVVLVQADLVLFKHCEGVGVLQVLELVVVGGDGLRSRIVHVHTPGDERRESKEQNRGSPQLRGGASDRVCHVREVEMGGALPWAAGSDPWAREARARGPESSKR